MNGSGITEWLEHNTGYPLKNPGRFSGVLSDASFVSYDNFIPVLNSINLTSTSIILNITFDDGNQEFTCGLESAVAGNQLRLRTSKRNYGVIVFGNLINDIKAGVYSESIVINSRFEEVCVRSIDSTKGVYSLNGLYQDVNIVFDDNLWFNSNQINAVSIPSNLESLTTKLNAIYVSTSTAQLIEIDGTDVTTVLQLDKPYAAICNHNGNIIGVTVTATKSALYDLQTIPGVKLVDNINYAVQSLLIGPSGNLWGLSGRYLLDFGQYPYTNTPVVKDTAISNIKAITCINDIFVACVDGNNDFANPPKKYSSMFYNLDVSSGSVVKSVAGIMNNPSLNSLADPKGGEHMPWIRLLANNGDTLCGITESGLVYDIDSSTLVATQSTQLPTTAAAGNPVTIFNGGVTFTRNQIIPLKTINGLTVDSINEITISGSETLVVSEENNDTLVFSLPMADQYLNVKRTKLYE